MLAVPIVALGMSPGVVHADTPKTVWKVLIHEEDNKILFGGAAVKIKLDITCPSSASGVVVDLSVKQSIDSPPHESEGEAESVGVICRGEAAGKWITVWADGSEDPYIKGLAGVKASLDWGGRDMGEDVRPIRLGDDGKGDISWVSIQGGTIKSNGNQVTVKVDYLCPSKATSVDIRAYVDQDLAEGGAGDAEGLAKKTGAKCTGHRESTTVTVTTGLPSTPTEGSPPCESQIPPPTENFFAETFVPENDGTFASGLACVQVQLGEAVGTADVAASQEGYFNLKNDD
jgi:hypothetical protein